MKQMEPMPRPNSSPSDPSPTKQQLHLLNLDDLIPSTHNPRKHSRQQIRAIAKSIEAFGFCAPLLADKNRQIIAGHGRYEAAKFLGLVRIPVIFLDHLTETQAKAYMLADNKLTDRSTWDDKMVAEQLKELSEMVLDFDIEAIGFETAELDFRVHSLEEPDAADHADEFAPAAGPAVSVPGDLWQLGEHRLYCGNALDEVAYTALMHGNVATAAFTDMPYNVKIDGHAGGKGRIKHREFAMASGEMSGKEFSEFLTTGLKAICAHTTPGAVIYSCMDWRHVGEMAAAGTVVGCDFLNLCIWVKSNGGMGSFYRSRHELVFVFRNGGEPHLNNVQLGRHGRNRTNVWNYAGVNIFARGGKESVLELHPTVKPVALVSDAILDSTKRDDIVLDPFIGSGTTILAAERTGRRCYGIEIDPLYVDTAIERWQRMTGRQAQNAHRETFAQVKAAAGIIT
jgi:DNA modification methylase